MSKEEHFNGKVAQKAIIVRQGKVLLTRDPRTPDQWELPGGRLNIGEDPKDGLKRELREELGADFEIGDAVYFKQFWHANDQARALVIVYMAKMSDSTAIKPDIREVMEYRWVSDLEWKDLNLFLEYRDALEGYFSRPESQ